MKRNTELRIFPSVDQLFNYAAQDFCQRAVSAVQAKGMFSVVLSGGNTPQLFFDILTQDQKCRENTPWKMIQFFFGDERYVPARDVRSNYHSAYEHLFSRVPICPKNIFRISTEFKDPEDAAKVYERTLRNAFDLVYLGLGEDAHTASLMPFNTALKNDKQLVASVFLPKSCEYRITLTPNAINRGKDIIFLVTGANKANAVWEVLEGPRDPQRYPAQLIRSAHGETFWFLDEAASGKLIKK